MRNKMFFVALMVVVFTLAIAGSAFAAWNNSTYTDWRTDASAGANPPFSSPHQGYATTTRNCGVCHAVHHATGEVLLAATVSGSCDYCHVGGAGGYTQVYGGVPGNHTPDNIRNHSNACTECHAVHGAQTVWASQGAPNILRTAGYTYTGAGKGGDPSVEQSGSDIGITKWCAGCHNYYYKNHSDVSHVMTTATASFAATGATYNGRVANVNSNTCQSCHDATAGFPHYTAAAPRFLSSGTVDPLDAAKVNNDGVCLDCHQWTGGTAGVGKTF